MSQLCRERPRGNALQQAARWAHTHAGPSSWATISELAQLSPTTTRMRLRVESPTFTFVPGQWVDVYIPDIDHVGGYSLTSLPSELPRVELAVKASAHPPAAWCTNRARVGDRVQLRVRNRLCGQPAAAQRPLNALYSTHSLRGGGNLCLAGDAGCSLRGRRRRTQPTVCDAALALRICQQFKPCRAHILCTNPLGAAICPGASRARSSPPRAPAHQPAHLA